MLAHVYRYLGRPKLFESDTGIELYKKFYKSVDASGYLTQKDSAEVFLAIAGEQNISNLFDVIIDEITKCTKDKGCKYDEHSQHP